MPIPQEFVDIANQVEAMREEWEETKDEFLKLVHNMVTKEGFNLTQLAEVSPFSYANLRVWVRAIDKANAEQSA